MPWLLESHGARAFIKIFPFIATALDKGGVVAIDEIAAAIHPVVPPEMVRYLRGGAPMKFTFIRDHAGTWPIRLMCRVLQVSASGCATVAKVAKRIVSTKAEAA